jgi:hypothetical protein
MSAVVHVCDCLDFHKRNQWGGNPSQSGLRRADGTRQKTYRPSHLYPAPSQTQREASADINLSYRPPVIANSGNVIKCNVGGGHMGNKLASENEAPFPEKLAVAERLNRNSVGLDIRESQAKLTRRRLKTVQKQLPSSEGVA